jgi:peptide/nickel transport system permease protein
MAAELQLSGKPNVREPALQSQRSIVWNKFSGAGSVHSVKTQDFIMAARMLGGRNWRIILRHIIPNVAGPIIVGVTLGVGGAIIIESPLSFLGLGILPPTLTWGNMLQDSQSTRASKPWLTIFPGLAILVVVLAVNFLGDGLQDALDPTA